LIDTQPNALRKIDIRILAAPMVTTIPGLGAKVPQQIEAVMFDGKGRLYLSAGRQVIGFPLP
jgi:hypothetical protein